MHYPTHGRNGKRAIMFTARSTFLHMASRFGIQICIRHASRRRPNKLTIPSDVKTLMTDDGSGTDTKLSLLPVAPIACTCSPNRKAPEPRLAKAVARSPSKRIPNDSLGLTPLLGAGLSAPAEKSALNAGVMLLPEGRLAGL